jgi:hypothetical protein
VSIVSRLPSKGTFAPSSSSTRRRSRVAQPRNVAQAVDAGRSSVAAMTGSAAFLAPEIGTEPSQRAAAVMSSLSILLRLFRRQRLHRQRVDFLPHAVAQRLVDELVPLHAALAREALETISAWKCWPSPITSTRSQARPASMPLLMLPE